MHARHFGLDSPPEELRNNFPSSNEGNVIMHEIYYGIKYPKNLA